MVSYEIVFYSRETGSVSHKRGYARSEAAAADLRKNGFTPYRGIWVTAGYFAKIREDKKA